MATSRLVAMVGAAAVLMVSAAGDAEARQGRKRAYWAGGGIVAGAAYVAGAPHGYRHPGYGWQYGPTGLPYAAVGHPPGPVYHYGGRYWGGGCGFASQRLWHDPFTYTVRQMQVCH